MIKAEQEQGGEWPSEETHRQFTECRIEHSGTSFDCHTASFGAVSIRTHDHFGGFSQKHENKY